MKWKLKIIRKKVTLVVRVAQKVFQIHLVCDAMLKAFMKRKPNSLATNVSSGLILPKNGSITYS